MKIIDGIGVSSGCAVGTVEVLIPKKIKITKKQLSQEEIEIELKNLEDLLVSYNEYLMANEGNEFVKLHMDLIQDPYVTETIKKKIIENKKNLKLSINETFMEICDVLNLSESEYIKDRIFDYLDIYQQLIELLDDDLEDFSRINTNEKFFLFVENLSPLMIDKFRDNLVGIVSTTGGKTSHSSLYAKSLGIPYLICENINLQDFIEYKNYAILDCDNNFLILNPSYNVMSGYKARAFKQRYFDINFDVVKTKNNREMRVCSNVASFEEYKFALSQGADGCGLFRTEFLYMGDFLPTENYQFNVFKNMAQFSNKPVTIRTFDIGADKKSKHFEIADEKNPFLGLRGFRLYEYFYKELRKHLRAILRASNYGKIKIMIPMITNLEEIVWIKNEISKVMDQLKEEKISFDEDIEFGIMIETPSSVMLLDVLIKEVDFVSIGTNDLTQYMLACDREHIKLQKLYDSFNPAIVRSIKHIVETVHKHNKKVSVCGNFASEVDAINLLILLGVDEISVTTDVLQTLKKEISKFDENYYYDFDKKFEYFKKSADIINYFDAR